MRFYLRFILNLTKNVDVFSHFLSSTQAIKSNYFCFYFTGLPGSKIYTQQHLSNYVYAYTWVYSCLGPVMSQVLVAFNLTRLEMHPNTQLTSTH